MTQAQKRITKKPKNKKTPQNDKQTKNVKCWIGMNMVFSEWKVKFHALNRNFCFCWQWRRNGGDDEMRNNLTIFISEWQMYERANWLKEEKKNHLILIEWTLHSTVACIKIQSNYFSVEMFIVMNNRINCKLNYKSETIQRI